MFLSPPSRICYSITGDSVTKALERIRIKYLAELTPFPLMTYAAVWQLDRLSGCS